jgi:DegV family protein with EDD domain
MTVRVVTDGGASLPPALPRNDVHMVPMTLRSEGRELDQQLNTDDLVELLDRDLTTSAPTPGAFLEAIEDADSGDGVVVVTVASQISASYAAARLACQDAGCSDRVRLVDSASATAGQGLVVCAAAGAAASGADVDAVAGAAAHAAGKVRLVAQIPGLGQLVRSGRVPAAAELASKITGLRPVFEVAAGRVRPVRPARSLAGAEARILAAWKQSMVPGARLHLAALHAGEPDAAKRLLEAVYGMTEPASSFVTELSPMMLAHTGAGLSGLSWWWETPATESG